MRSSVSIIVSSLLCVGDYRTPTLICNRSRFIHASLLVAGMCFLLAVLAGCRQPTEPVSYQDLCGLTSDQMGVMDEEDVRQWIEEKYNSVPVKSQKVTNGESIVIYIWQYDGIAGNAYLRDGRLFRISLHEVENGPTFGQVVAGLGPPEMVDRYAGMYEPMLYTVDLDYPALGVSVGASGMEERNKLMHEGGLAAPLTEDMQVDYVECYTPGSMEDVLREVFFLPPEYVSYHMQRRIPWPGFGDLVPLDY